jgi:DNA invertase Pin-like site-specific DNA recombinase
MLASDHATASPYADGKIGISKMANHPLLGKIISAYVRVSSDKQDAERQRGTLREWATRNGLTIANWFADETGKNPRDLAWKRKDFNRLLDFVRAGGVQVVLVDALDRFGTGGVWQLGKYISLLQEHGCELWSASEGCLSSDEDGKVIATVVGQQASGREQREKGWRSIGEKVKRAKAGEYPGGYPPLGCDVVCYGSDGKAKWRLVWIGHHTRIKINAKDGTEERYEGKGNSPAHDATDTLRYAPTIHKDRIKTLNDCMKWYADENISPTQIATRLTVAGIKPVFGEAWNKQGIKELLRNPACIGLPAYNKQGGSRFWEFLGGEMRPVAKDKGRVKAGRKRDKADWIGPDKPLFKPLVPVVLFNRVQRKLEQSSKEYAGKVKPRSPRTASFWLRNIVVCAGCNRPMRAWNANIKGQQPYRSYYCANYGQFGKVNPTGCMANRIKAALLEEIVERYLAETHEKISRLLKASEEGTLDLLQPMERQLDAKGEELLALHRGMVGVIADHERKHGDVYNKAAGAYYAATKAKVGKARNGRATLPIVPTTGIYQYVFKQRQPELEAELAEVEREHGKLADKWIDLPKGATALREKLNGLILQLEGRMAKIKEQLGNIGERYGELVKELENRQAALERARETIAGDATYRRKAALVSEVIKKVVCTFRPLEGQGTQPRSELVRVEVFPREGNAATMYPDGNKPGPG